MLVRTRSVVVGTVLGLVLCAGSASAQIQWRSDPGRTMTIPAMADPGGVLAATAAGGRLRVVAQASGPLTDEQRALLEQAGLRLLSPVGGHAHFAVIDREHLDAVAITASGLVTGVRAMEDRWKIDPRLLSDQVTALWGGISPQSDERLLVGDPVIPMTVYLFEDQVADGVAEKVIAKHATTVSGALVSLPVFTIEAPVSAIRALAAEGIVQWIEPSLPAMGEMNAENRALTQANLVQAAPYNLNGQGVSVFVFDGGTVRTTHQDFGGRASLVDSDAQSSHATHCAGTIGGSGAASGGANRGMAPGVTILSAGVSTAGSGWLYSNPTDIEADYATAWDRGADLTSNSIGTNTAANGFDCAWEGDYPVVSALIDTIVRGDSAFVTDNNPLRICWAGGNERGASRCGVSYRTIGPPAGSKNPMIVGAVNSNDDSMTGFSGWGPTDDGRMKPDFSAPGCQVGGDGGVTSCSSSSDTAYASLCGTSMATPTTAGCVALMLQDYRAMFPSQPDPRNSTLKAILSQSAVDRGVAGPDYQFGYGSIRVRDAIDLMRTLNFTEQPILPGEIHQYEVDVAAGSGPLVVTVAWDDPAGTPNVVPSLINDLDVQIVGPTGTVHHPWKLDPANPGGAAVRTGANTLDNIEQVRIDAPAPGRYSVRVSAIGSQRGLQPYSIVASRALAFGGGTPIVIVSPAQLAPELVLSGAEATVSTNVFLSNDTLAAGSVRVRYSPTGVGPFASIPMTNVSGALWTATLPSVSCHDTPAYYFEAAGDLAGTVTAPGGAPANLFRFNVDAFVNVSVDTMETANGWAVVTSPDPVTTGAWERVNPEATDQQPGDDHTEGDGVLCWITGGQAGVSAGSFDVDNGETRLMSRAFDLTGFERPRIGYWRWYHNGTSTTADDTFLVEISNDDGATWTQVERVGPTGNETDGGWIYKVVNISEFVTPSNRVRLRFIASDYATGHVVEAALDDVAVQRYDCAPTCAPDFNGDGFLDFFDYDDYVGCFEGAACPPGRTADFNRDDFVDFFDYDAFVLAFEAGC